MLDLTAMSLDLSDSSANRSAIGLESEANRSVYFLISALVRIRAWLGDAGILGEVFLGMLRLEELLQFMLGFGDHPVDQDAKRECSSVARWRRWG